LPTIHFDCREGKHLEAEEIYRRSGSYCWGWSKTHTYQFPNVINVTRIVGEINTGPSEAPVYFEVRVRLSVDNKNWIDVGRIGAKGTEGYVPFSVDVGGIPARYLQFRAVAGYVDGSRGEVYYKERYEMPIRLSCPRPIISSLGRVHFIRCIKLPRYI